MDIKMNWKQHLTDRRKKFNPLCGHVAEPWARLGELATK